MYDIYSNLNGRPSAAIVLKQSFGSNANRDFRFKNKTRGHQEKVPKGMDYEISYDVSKF
jgi:HAE1 family hydrophobic/amphiphilic exporter-1